MTEPILLVLPKKEETPGFILFVIFLHAKRPGGKMHLLTKLSKLKMLVIYGKLLRKC